ncbi:hypothetical protein FrEUN1fDRAFT_7823 [Parafrankia sp. EUN1f]|nr:hypothetical protein FrEUN1fDRAFT_7823 [Parafrankia sp. EUN1f]
MCALLVGARGAVRLSWWALERLECGMSDSTAKEPAPRCERPGNGGLDVAGNQDREVT